MATLAFSVAGQAIGGLVGGPFGATVGRALGALAGSVVDNALFGGEQSQPQVGRDVRLQGASEGTAIPRIYGWNRVAGNIIWATELERIAAQGSGSKGSSSRQQSEDVIAANFAVAFCEGEVSHIGRIWADGEVLDTEGLNVRFYSGSENQTADSLIAAKQGASDAPTYRGVCYAVFERLPLEPFGNRIPNISAELCRTVGDLESDIRAITVIPGATEFGYDPEPRLRVVGPGTVETENAHIAGKVSDWTVSIDELQAVCPNLEHVALVVAWFGDDLRCGQCTIRPRVEGADRQIKGTEWVVNGLTRDEVPVVSTHDGGPAYGGTPSDNAVLAAIADLRARGLKVTLYPFVLLDIPQGNSLTDPYTQDSGQPAYPWRGRITCDTAPGVGGSPDGSAAVDAQVAAFTGAVVPAHFSAGSGTVTYAGPADWGYRRMVLHYAKLVQMAGGVDTFLIGSELRGLTTLRNAPAGFPFVDDLMALGKDVRSVVGGATKITYGADWTEYAGYQPPDAPGDRLFHLDPLWASADIDAVGIDNYMPLSDWRDGTTHEDAAMADTPHDLAYLQANIAGGEGYDWFYASDADRTAQNRTPITDSAHGEPWVWRNKDIAGWWGNAHHNRIDGVRSETPTAWVPESKPIWLTELGCGAVDKGANQPNAFGDAKSAEDRRPYFSSGAPDTLIQRQFLRAHHQWWRPDAPEFNDSHNPASGVYAGRMLDPDRIYLWTWDARPFPAFPGLIDVWAEGVNHATGHWLTGRLGALGVAEMLTAVAKDYGAEITAAYSGGLSVDGFQIDRIVSMRDATEPVLEAASLNIADRGGNLVALRPGTAVPLVLEKHALVAADAPLARRKRPDISVAVGHLGMHYLDRQHDYLNGTVTAFALSGEGGMNFHSGLVIDSAAARGAAENILSRAISAEDALEFALPPSMLALEVGDVFELEGQGDGPFVVTEIRDGTYRQTSARLFRTQSAYAVANAGKTTAISVAPAGGEPLVHAAHLPDENATASRLVFGGMALPWPGEIIVRDDVTGSELVQLTQPAMLGELVAPLPPAGPESWDRRNVLDVKLYSGHLVSVTPEAVAAGSNRLAVRRDNDSWEIIGFADAELVAGNTYRLTNLLRGLNGTSDGMEIISTGAPVMLLDSRTVSRDVPPELLGGMAEMAAFAGRKDNAGVALNISADVTPVLPLAPAHVRVERDAPGGDVRFRWIRRNRRDGNGWALMEIPLDHMPEAYRIEIFDGPDVVRSADVNTPEWVYDVAAQIADFGSPPSGIAYTIAQISPVYGAGHKASGVFNG